MTRGLIDSSSAASFCTQFDMRSASTTACRSMSSSGMPVGGIFTAGIFSLPVGEQHRALDDVLELADVAGPVVPHHDLQGVRLNAVDLLLQLAAEALDEE